MYIGLLPIIILCFAVIVLVALLWQYKRAIDAICGFEESAEKIFVGLHYYNKFDD